MNGSAKQGRRSRGEETVEKRDGDLVDKVIHINRVAKVVKGGRRFSFSALVVVGDRAGKIGLGSGKASEVPEAIRKAVAAAKKNMIKVYLHDASIPYEVMGHYGAGKVFMRPASKGTGVIAGGAVRAILEAVGIRDILTKSLGSSNQNNMARATVEGLRTLQSPKQIKQIRSSGAESRAVENDETTQSST